MSSPQRFDYDQPSRDALAGINLEVSDSSPAVRGRMFPGETERLVLPALVDQLFGIIVSVEDESNAERSGPLTRS